VLRAGPLNPARMVRFMDGYDFMNPRSNLDRWRGIG
jgi:hypothetical protein